MYGPEASAMTEVMWTVTERAISERAVSAVSKTGAESKPERTIGPTVAQRHADVRSVVGVTVGKIAAATIVTVAVVAVAIEWIIERRKISAEGIRLVTVPIVSGRIEVLVDGAIVIIFTHDHIPVPLVVGFHEIEPFIVVLGLERRQLGITSRKAKHGHDQPHWK